MNGTPLINNKETCARLFYLDVSRVIAIAAVVSNHALSRSFAIWNNTYEAYLNAGWARTLIKGIIYVCSRLGVPLFLMVTGALFLERNFEDKKVLNRFLKHNWLTLFKTTEIWLFTMYWLLQTIDGSVLKIQGLSKACIKCIETMLFINQITMSSMWYMPMILCVYLMLPVISVSLKRIGNKYMLMLCVLVVVTGMVIPNANVALNALGTGKYITLSYERFFSYYLVYIIIGYWISKQKLETISDRIVLLLFCVSVFFTGLFQFWTFTTPIDYVIQYADVGVLISSVFLFELIRRYTPKLYRFKRTIRRLSELSFGIYLLHMCFMEIITRKSTLNGMSKFFYLFVISFFGSVIVIELTPKRIRSLLFRCR